MKIKIGDQIYDAAALDELSLKTLLQLQRETADFGHPLNAADIQRISVELAALPDDQARAQHPDALWLTAVTIWAARKLAGEQVTFEDAIDFPLSSLTYLPDPQDRVGPQKPRPRKGSGADGKHPRKSATKTSEPQSTDA